MMAPRLLLVFGLFIVPALTLSGQTTTIDSLSLLIEYADERMDQQKLANWYHQLGNAYDQEAGDQLSAIDATERALRLRLEREPQDSLAVLISAYNLGAYYQETGDYDRAIDRLRIVLDRAPNAKAGVAYYKLGVVYGELGELELADRAFEAALPLSPWVDNEQTRAILFQEWGSAYLLPGDPTAAQRAIEILSRALPAYEAAGDLSPARSNSYLYLLNRYGLAHLYAGALTRAEGIFQLAAAYNRECCQDEEIDDSLFTNLGILYRRLDQPDRAEAFHRKSLAINQSLSEGRPDPYLAKNYNNLSTVALHRGRARQALALAQQSLYWQLPELPDTQAVTLPSLEILLAQTDPISLHTYVWDAARARSAIAARSGEQTDRDLGMATYHLADALVDELRRRQAEEGSKLSWRRQALDFYADAVRAALRARLPADVLYFSEKSRGILLLDARLQRAAEARLPAPVADRLRSLRRRINVYREDGGQSAALLQASKELDDLRDSLPALTNLTTSVDTGIAARLQRHLAADEVLVEYFLHDSICLAVVVSPEQTRVVELTDLATIRPRLTAYQRTLLASDEAFDSLPAQWLYQNLLEPLNLTAGLKLIVVGDDALLSAPVSAWLTTAVEPGQPYRDWPWLFRKHVVLNAWSASTYLLNQQAPAAPKDKTLYLAPMAATGNELELPLSREPARLFPADWPLEIHLGEAANRQLFQEKADAYAVIHLATHAYQGERGHPPYFLLADPQESAYSTTDLLNHDFHARLVVLSACQTGRGVWQPGEGVASIGRDFARGGAQSSVMSLWPVDEAASIKLLSGFYAALARGDQRGSALCSAYGSYLDAQQNNQLAHPFRWAGFVYYGPEQILEGVHDKSYLSWWWWAIILPMLGGLLWFVWVKLRLAK